MARIPDVELERIKREVPCAELAASLGVELKPHGANLMGLCPFHDDHEPSFVVTPSSNLWHCLGACQAGGSNIDLLMRAKKLSFREAALRLREQLSPLAAAVPGAPSAAATSSLAAAADDRALLREVVGFYHRTLKESPEALAYLETRGLRSAEMVERFQLGFANRTLGYRLPHMRLRAGAEIRGRLQRLGILRESGHEHMSGSLVIPVLDEHGNVSEIYGRKITANLRPGTPLHLYLPGPHRGVWNIEALKATKEVILCEALIDALTFWCAGFRNVTAAYGVEGFTDDHLSAFKQYGTERVLIAYDRDEAGERAAEKLAKKLSAAGIECRRVNFPHQMDANSYALKVTPAERSLGVLLGCAVPIGQSLTISTAPAPPPAAVEPPAAPAVSTIPTTVLERESLPSLAASPSLPSAPSSPAAEEPSAAATTDHEPSTPDASPPAGDDIPVEQKPDGIHIRLGERLYRVRGFENNTAFGKLAVNLRAERAGAVHADNLDLCRSRDRNAFSREAALELALKEEVVRRDLGKLLLKLEELQDHLIRDLIAPKEKTVSLSDDEETAALELLRAPDLLGRILCDFERCGVVGERTNKLVGYLAAVSRLLEKPLGVMIQSSSAAGKTALMDAVLGFVPAECQVKYSAMTGQSLFYMGEQDLRHRILAVAEEEGASRATYALKLLQSEGELSIASTGKDPVTGKLVTHEYRVCGPVMTIFSTTAVELDPELQNRCVVLGVDESREQTRAIHAQQRREQSADGIWERRRRAAIRKLHQNAQRLLRPLEVENPFVSRLSFPDGSTRTRRDHMKYLTLISTIALLHQHQRPLCTESREGESRSFIEVSAADITLANRIAAEVLGRTLDELAPQSRRLLLLIHEMVSTRCRELAMERADFRFSRREVREHTGLGNTQLKLHLHRLEELEYLLVHRGGRGQSIVYELLYNGEGQDGSPFLPGLIDPEELGNLTQDEKKSGFSENKSGSGRPPVGAKSGGGRDVPGAVLPVSRNGFPDPEAENGENAYLKEKEKPASYVNGRRSEGVLASLAAAADSMLEAHAGNGTGA